MIEVFIEHVPQWLPKMLVGAGIAVKILAGAYVLANVLGLLLAFGSRSSHKSVRFASRVYIEIGRGLPVLTVLFLIYFVLPEFGVLLDGLTAAVVGLGMYYAAYLAEVYRAGIDAVDRGQSEAALSIGLTSVGAMRWVVLPQAFTIIVPPLTNSLVSLLKDTSLASTIAVAEIMMVAKTAGAVQFLPLEAYVLAAIVYFVMCYPLTLLAGYLERRLRRTGDTGPSSGDGSSVSEASSATHRPMPFEPQEA